MSGLLLWYTLKEEYFGEMPSISREGKKKGDFEKCSVLPFLLPLKQVPPSKRANTGSGARHRSNLSSSTLRKPGSPSGPAAMWNEESTLPPAAVQCGAHQRPRGTPPVLEAPTDTTAGDRQRFILFNRLQHRLQAELAGFATENTKLPLHLLLYALKSSKALLTGFTFLRFA